jgi:hypothetical protein
MEAAHDASHWIGKAIFPPKVYSHNENPDRYAAAICIRVQADVCCADILPAKAAASPCCETRSGPQMLSGCYFVEPLLLFLLGCLLGCLLCLLRFLGHVALRDPKVVSMQVGYRHAWIQSTPQLQN